MVLMGTAVHKYRHKYMQYPNTNTSNTKNTNFSHNKTWYQTGTCLPHGRNQHKGSRRLFLLCHTLGPTNDKKCDGDEGSDNVNKEIIMVNDDDVKQSDDVDERLCGNVAIGRW